MNDFFSNSPIISVYSRKEALEDGIQINLSEKYPDACSIYKYPVFCTKAVWDLIESAVANKESLNDYSGVIWDICWMSTKSSDRQKILGGTGVEFSLIITGANEKPSRIEDGMPIYRLHSVCGALDFDDPTPVITISFPAED